MAKPGAGSTASTLSVLQVLPLLRQPPSARRHLSSKQPSTLHSLAWAHKNIRLPEAPARNLPTTASWLVSSTRQRSTSEQDSLLLFPSEKRKRCCIFHSPGQLLQWQMVPPCKNYFLTSTFPARFRAMPPICWHTDNRRLNAFPVRKINSHSSSLWNKFNCTKRREGWYFQKFAENVWHLRNRSFLHQGPDGWKRPSKKPTAWVTKQHHLQIIFMYPL